MVDHERLTNSFMELAAIDSPSGKERALAENIASICRNELGMDIRFDNSTDVTGADIGNMAATLRGTDTSLPPLFFNAHMDTVEPGTGVTPKLEDGRFFSEGDTVLGADDKAGIAIILEAMRLLSEYNVPHGEIELLFTVSEEIGLVGAKAMDTGFIKAQHGFALDSSSPDAVITRAPAAIRIDAEFVGKAAHAGLNPEDGINAIQMAAIAISEMRLGRIDSKTTANIGIIAGGQATNIVPERCLIRGEVRSHDVNRLQKVCDTMLSAMHRACIYADKGQNGNNPDNETSPPWLNTTVREDYPVMAVPDTSPLIQSVMQAGKRLGRNLYIAETGGGSDANIFNGMGIETVILGIGMKDVHTTRESILLDDMVKTTTLLVETVKTWTLNN